MDVDDVQPTRYSPFINFFDVSSNFPWQEPRSEQIRQRRSDMDGTLIFDILLNSGGIENTYSLYPPENQAGLQKLLDTIELSNYDTLKKDCLVYFLLKWHQDGREKNFSTQRCIPPQFAALADAYWHLDTGINVPKAVALLSDSRLNRDYASKIIRTISLYPDSGPLIRRYVQTAKPQLIEPLDIESYTIALAKSSVMEAWQFFCTFNETDQMRGRLFRKILAWAVTPTIQPSALKELLAFPFSQVEESTLLTFVQKPPEELNFSEVAILQDLVCVRLIQAGRYSEAIKLDRQFTSLTSPKNLRITKDRSKMVNEVYAALPAVERSLLELELDPSVQQQVPLAPKPVSPEMRRPPAKDVADTSLSQSWEDVTMPDTLVNKSTPLRDVRHPLNTPTFGATSRTSTSAHGAPILPINFSGVASGSRTAPRKSLPLSSSHLGSSQMRSSLSGVGSRMSFGGSSAIASPASGMKIPTTTTITPSHVTGPTFVSAERQQNAFYQPPPPRTNGVKRAFEEDTTPRSPEQANVSADSMETEANMEVEEANHSSAREERRGRKSETIEEGDEEENALQYSVFESKKEPKATKPSQKVVNKAPPGSFMLDNEDAMDEDVEVNSNSRKRTSKSSSRPVKSQTTSKPPAKKARQTKQVRNIPGGLVDEEDDDDEEEEDEVAPLRAPSPPRRPLRKGRSSASVEMTDDYEGVQTRRRSSRLTTGGSVHGGSPEPPAPKAKKSARASGTRKKR